MIVEDVKHELCHFLTILLFYIFLIFNLCYFQFSAIMIVIKGKTIHNGGIRDTSGDLS